MPESTEGISDSNDQVQQIKHNTQTFGANIYTLYRDAFFLSDGFAMGEFAKNKINQWIQEIEMGRIGREEAEKLVGLIGEPISNKIYPFFPPSLKIISGEISAKEAAEERIWAGRTPRAPDAPRSARGIT